MRCSTRDTSTLLRRSRPRRRGSRRPSRPYSSLHKPSPRSATSLRKRSICLRWRGGSTPSTHTPPSTLLSIPPRPHLTPPAKPSPTSRKLPLSPPPPRRRGIRMTPPRPSESSRRSSRSCRFWPIDWTRREPHSSPHSPSTRPSQPSPRPTFAAWARFTLSWRHCGRTLCRRWLRTPLHSKQKQRNTPSTSRRSDTKSKRLRNVVKPRSLLPPPPSPRTSPSPRTTSIRSPPPRPSTCLVASPPRNVGQSGRLSKLGTLRFGLPMSWMELSVRHTPRPRPTPRRRPKRQRFTTR
mmetsp:Transcript_19661/g.42489  ORF Transcript_19661/g.42489 Transcript_19661/m.42489 type:complete len:294 (+) Transcript_19661:1239-2120(+)